MLVRWWKQALSNEEWPSCVKTCSESKFLAKMHEFGCNLLNATKYKDCHKALKTFSIYTLSDLGVLSNLIGSLSLANEHYSPPTEWIMRKPNKNKMTGVNSRFAGVSESIFNGFLLKMLLRSLSVYILKQLFFSISVNSGRILTSPLRGSVNILPLFTSISKNNC